MARITIDLDDVTSRKLDTLCAIRGYEKKDLALQAVGLLLDAVAREDDVMDAAFREVERDTGSRRSSSRTRPVPSSTRAPAQPRRTTPKKTTSTRRSTTSRTSSSRTSTTRSSGNRSSTSGTGTSRSSSSRSSSTRSLDNVRNGTKLYYLDELVTLEGGMLQWDGRYYGKPTPLCKDIAKAKDRRGPTSGWTALKNRAGRTLGDLAS